MTIALIVPVYKKFDLFTRLMHSVDTEVRPYVIDSYYANRGCAGAWNEGMRKAILDGYRYAIITNDDVEFLPGTIEKIYTTLKETDAVMVSASQNVNTPDATEIYEGADFFCFGVDMIKLIDSCGSFDENFFPAYFEDNDMHYRMRLANVKGYIHPGAGAKHVGSATQNADPHNPVCPSERFEQLREYFRKKWGGVPGEERFTKPFNKQEKEIWDWDERE